MSMGVIVPEVDAQGDRAKIQALKVHEPKSPWPQR
jgi:hypothetical protein